MTWSAIDCYILTAMCLYRSDMEYALDKLDDTELDGRRIKLTEESKLMGGRSRSRLGAASSLL